MSHPERPIGFPLAAGGMPPNMTHDLPGNSSPMELFPAIPLADWQDTKATLHRFAEWVCRHSSVDLGRAGALDIRDIHAGQPP